MAADLDEDHCFKLFDEWLALEQWERDAQPDEDPARGGALEDCEYWRHKAFAALSYVVPLIRAHIADEIVVKLVRSHGFTDDLYMQGLKDAVHIARGGSDA